MIITTTLTERQLRKVNNLMLNCRNKQEMFDGLWDIGLNAFHALHMSNSFEPLYASRSIVKVSFTVLSPISQVAPRTYDQCDYEPRIVAE